MATAKTGSFYLTETITLPAATASGGRVQGNIDVGAYVNVGTGQALAIDQVDFVYQHSLDYGSDPANMLQANGTITVQLTDLNPGTAFVRADDQSLISSGALAIDDANNIATHVTETSHVRRLTLSPRYARCLCACALPCRLPMPAGA